MGGILCAHLYEAIKAKKDKGLTPIWSSIAILATLLFPLLQSVSLSTDKDGSGTVTPFTGFEVMSKTPIYIVTYVLLALALICFILEFVFSKKEGKEKVTKYLTIGGMSLAGVSAVLMIVGQNTIEANGLYVNLSYGFFLMIAFAILGTAISSLPFFAEMHFNKLKKEEALEPQAK